MSDASDKLLEQLFLLEVVIDKLTLRNRCDHSPQCTCTLTHYDESIPFRIRIKFINFPCFEIEQECFSKELDHVKGLTIVENFSSGKSCLFPMAPLDLVRAMQLYPLAVTVYQRKQEDSPAKILGAARVPLSQEMIDAVRKVTYCEEELPINTNLLGNYPLTGPGGKDVGRVHVFVRLSCFGQSIVTQFQLVDEFQSFLFKNSRADTAFTCKKCTGRINVPCPPYKDVSPLKALICDVGESHVEEVRDTTYAQCPFNPKSLAKLCECDIHRERKKEDERVLEEKPYCRGCDVAFEPQMGPCEKIFVAEDVRAADISAAFFEVEMSPDKRLVVTQTCKECCEQAHKRGIICCEQSTMAAEPATPAAPAETEGLAGVEGGGIGVVAVVGGGGDVREVKEHEPPPPEVEPSSEEKPPEEKKEEAPPVPPEWFTFGNELIYLEIIPIIHPPIRYDTTSCLSNAWDDHSAPAPKPPIRYDTTSSLTGAFQDLQRYIWPPNPLVRYDTTGCLSPAFEDATPPVPELKRNPPVRYDNTGILSSAYNHPPVRYDNTGKLSSAYISDEPADIVYLLPAFPASKAPKSIHLLEYKPLMSYDVGPDWTMLELHDLIGKRPKRKSCASPSKKRRVLPTCPPKIMQYPTVRRGHKRCLDVQFRVPSRMGWLWNTSITGLPYRPGWRPGAIMRAVSARIHSFHKEFGVELLTGLSKKKRQKSPDEPREYPPTLVLSRRRGKYHLSVRPLPEKATDKASLDVTHYAPMAARTISTEVRPYSVDLTVSKSTSLSGSSDASRRARRPFSEDSQFSSGARRSFSSSSSVCPPCECKEASDDDTDSLKIEFVAPANYSPRWKLPVMHHEETLVTAEELLAARKKSKKEPEESPPEEKGKKGKKGGDKKGKGKKK